MGITRGFGMKKLEACEGKEGRSVRFIWLITYKQLIVDEII